MRLSPACCLLHSAGCCCHVCGVTDGLEHHWRAGEDFQERRQDTDTSHTPPFSSSGRAALLSQRGSSLNGTRPGAGLRLFATGWCGGCLGDRTLLHHGCGDDAGSIEYGKRERRWRRCISPESGCHCDDGISPGTNPERALPDGWRRRGEEPAQPLSSPSLPLTGLTGRGGQRPIGGTDDMRCGPLVLDRRQPQPGAHSRRTSPGFQKKRTEKIRPRGTLGALILPCRLNRGLNWVSWGRRSAHARGDYTLPEAGRRTTAEYHGRGVLGFVQGG
jgi:hypothetical protein